MIVLILLGLACYVSQVSTQVNSPGATSRFSPGGQYIMLTFSGGPHHYATPKILDILKSEKVKATFFINGASASYYNDLLVRMHREGHEIGNHGYYHNRPFTKLTPEDIVTSVNQTNKVITNITKSSLVKHFRPPSGLTNADVNQLIKRNGHSNVILWSLDSHDLTETNPNEITKTLLKKAVPGDIILMHDSVNQTIIALPEIIKGLYKQGYEFLTINDVASFPDDSPH